MNLELKAIRNFILPLLDHNSFTINYAARQSLEKLEQRLAVEKNQEKELYEKSESSSMIINEAQSEPENTTEVSTEEISKSSMESVFQQLILKKNTVPSPQISNRCGACTPIQFLDPYTKDEIVGDKHSTLVLNQVSPVLTMPRNLKTYITLWDA